MTPTAALKALADVLGPLPGPDGGVAIVLATDTSPPAFALLSTGEVVLRGDQLRVALHAGGSAARSLGDAFTILVPAGACALRVEVATAGMRRAGPLAVVEGRVRRIRATSEHPWRLELSFAPIVRRKPEPTLRYWHALRAWLTAGAVEPAPAWPA